VEAVAPAAPSIGSCRILVVDDDAISRNVVSQYLITSGHEVTAVSNAPSAIKALITGNSIGGDGSCNARHERPGTGPVGETIRQTYSGHLAHWLRRGSINSWKTGRRMSIWCCTAMLAVRVARCRSPNPRPASTWAGQPVAAAEKAPERREDPPAPKAQPVAAVSDRRKEPSSRRRFEEPERREDEVFL